MGDGTIQLIAVVILVAFSGIFSATETAFSTFNRVRMKNAAADGDSKSALVMRLSESYDSLLSTILIGNNIVNIALSAIMTVMFLKLDPANGAALSTAVSTVIVLIFGEISPKSLAKESPDGFAKFIAPFINLLMILFTPLTFIFKGWKMLLAKIFNFKAADVITEDELITIVDEAEQDGGIDEHEGELIRSAIEFNDVEVADIITPRVDIAALDRESTLTEIADTFIDTGFSRLPVYEETVDNIIGVLHEKDFSRLTRESGTDIAPILRRALYVPCHIKISKLLSLFQQEKAHMAIVVDDYGGTMGLATLEDVLEELVGDIWDEHDEVVQLIKPEQDGSITVEGAARPTDVFEYFAIDSYDDEDLPQTMNGWVTKLAGDLPEEGSSFEGEGLAVNVVKTDGKLIETLSVRKLEPEIEEDGNDKEK